ncbi:MAG: HAD family hydrolase [Ruminococcaceae bacterium]|nr:HAD family hydrolase [Oscillospiraceae bacterium]
MKTRLMIFDLDGTVLDTVTTIAHFCNEALIKYGLKTFPVERYKYFAGEGAKKLTENILTAQNAYNEDLHIKLFDYYMESYDKTPAYLTTIFKGLKETLDELKKMGIKIAIVSNKPHFATLSVTEELYGKGYFDLIFGQRENVPLKPDPTAVLETVSHFKVKKEECIYVGDTSTDMITGKNAGIYTVGVLWGFRDENELLENGADKVIKSPEELLELGIRNEG